MVLLKKTNISVDEKCKDNDGYHYHHQLITGGFDKVIGIYWHYQCPYLLKNITQKTGKQWHRNAHNLPR
jgi:hypothetical protein